MKKYYCKNINLLKLINSIKVTLEPQEYFKIGLNYIKIHLESENSTKTNKKRKELYSPDISIYYSHWNQVS